MHALSFLSGGGATGGESLPPFPLPSRSSPPLCLKTCLNLSFSFHPPTPAPSPHTYTRRGLLLLPTGCCSGSLKTLVAHIISSSSSSSSSSSTTSANSSIPSIPPPTHPPTLFLTLFLDLIGQLGLLHEYLPHLRELFRHVLHAHLGVWRGEVGGWVGCLGRVNLGWVGGKTWMSGWVDRWVERRRGGGGLTWKIFSSTPYPCSLAYARTSSVICRRWVGGWVGGLIACLCISLAVVVASSFVFHPPTHLPTHPPTYLHRTELGPTHRAEVRVLPSIRVNRLIVVSTGGDRVHSQVELILLGGEGGWVGGWMD